METVERGPKGGKFGIKITHPDFYTGRALILSAETAESQAQWVAALNDCARVTMENALLGDSMIEKLRAHGTAAEKEKEDAMRELVGGGATSGWARRGCAAPRGLPPA